MVLTLRGIAKEYNLRPVLDDVNLTLEPGTAYVLTAPNGSGKTTLLQIMAGLIRATRGDVLLDGRPVKARDRQKLSVLLQQPLLYADLTALENLTYFARLYGVPQAKQVAVGWLERVGLSDACDQRVQSFSKGMKQRLAIARSLLHEPEVLLLDEPFDGLDDSGQRMLTRLLNERLQEQASIFLVSHRTEEVTLPAVSLTLRFGRVAAC